MKRKLIHALLALCILAIAGIASLWGINEYIKYSTEPLILTAEEAAELPDIDCILILGCKVRSNGQPSPMLKDRLDRGIELYRAETSPVILMSGDNGSKTYDEVSAMERYALEEGIPQNAIFKDHAGFSTYESMYRAKAIFGAERILIVTQKYHLYRSLYIADRLGLKAWGVASDHQQFAGQASRDLREILARAKDFFKVMIRPRPTYLGDPIPLVIETP